jgi:hypothetical protein
MVKMVSFNYYKQIRAKRQFFELPGTYLYKLLLLIGSSIDQNGTFDRGHCLDEIVKNLGDILYRRAASIQLRYCRFLVGSHCM